MNLFNIRALPNKGADVALVESGDGGSTHLRIGLANFRDSRAPRLTGYGGPPNPYENDQFTPATASLSDPMRRVFIETDQSNAIAADSLDAFATGQRSIKAAIVNPNLSELAQRKSLATEGTGFVAAAGGHFAKLQAISAALDKTGTALFEAQPPDSAGAAIDTEARAEFRKLSTEEQFSLLRNIGKPDMARLLLALKRTPIPWGHAGIADLVGKAWIAQVTAQRPQEVAQYQAARANNEWSTGLVSLLARSVMDSYGLDGFDVYQALKPTGGVGVVQINPTAIQSFEHRIARAAAA